MAAAALRFESGALATLHATTAAAPGLPARLQIMGDHGTAVLEDDRLVLLRTDAGDDRVDAAQPSFDDAVRRQYDDLHLAITTGSAPTVTLEQATLALATVHGLYRSAATGQVVDPRESLRIARPEGGRSHA